MNFTIWLLFSRSKASSSYGRIQHLLCQGYRKDNISRPSEIPGVCETHKSSHVLSITSWPWTHVLPLLGKARERMMIDLILDCGIFLPIENASGSYYQLSGK